LSKLEDNQLPLIELPARKNPSIEEYRKKIKHNFFASL